MMHPMRKVAVEWMDNSKFKSFSKMLYNFREHKKHEKALWSPAAPPHGLSAGAAGDEKCDEDDAAVCVPSWQQ